MEEKKRTAFHKHGKSEEEEICVPYHSDLHISFVIGPDCSLGRMKVRKQTNKMKKKKKKAKKKDKKKREINSLDHVHLEA